MPARETVTSKTTWGRQSVEVRALKEHGDSRTRVSTAVLNQEGMSLCGKCKEGW